MILHGHPFARVVAKEKLDIFQFVQTDSMSYKAVVFSGGKPVGMIDQPIGAIACFEPFPSQTNFWDYGFPTLFNALSIMAWSLRWFLLPVQAVILLFVATPREKRVQHSSP